MWGTSLNRRSIAPSNVNLVYPLLGSAPPHDPAAPDPQLGKQPTAKAILQCHIRAEPRSPLMVPAHARLSAISSSEETDSLYVEDQPSQRPPQYSPHSPHSPPCMMLSVISFCCADLGRCVDF